MFTAKKDGTGYTLAGVIDETVNFASSFPGSESSMTLNCKEVSRINSVGIKLWREHFQKVRQAGGALKFKELSPPLVSTLNYLSDFIEKKEIESICAPFLCSKCNAITLQTLTLDQAKKYLSSQPKVACNQCKTDAEFDEIPEEYFAFLNA